MDQREIVDVIQGGRRHSPRGRGVEGGGAAGGGVEGGGAAGGDVEGGGAAGGDVEGGGAAGGDVEGRGAAGGDVEGGGAAGGDAEGGGAAGGGAEGGGAFDGPLTRDVDRWSLDVNERHLQCLIEWLRACHPGIPSLSNEPATPTSPYPRPRAPRSVRHDGVCERIGLRELAAFACVAEIECAASEASGAWRPDQFKRTHVALCARASGASVLPTAPHHDAIAEANALSTADARAEVLAAAEALSSSLRSRIRTLWLGCGLDRLALDRVLARAKAAAEEMAEEEAAAARANAAFELASAAYAQRTASQTHQDGTGASTGTGTGVSVFTGGCLVLGDGVVVGAECAQLTWLLLRLRRHAERTINLRSSASQRDALSTHLRRSCARLAPMYHRYASRSRLDTVPGTGGAPLPPAALITSLEAEIVSTVSLLRQATVSQAEIARRPCEPEPENP